ncbi:MAG: UDP-glucose 6-dehydrogenase TuaD [Chlamydiae bacterium]|nr:UDP-glucose 6-dehydrogenase TuaD [Chlamydiota bacterium]
MEILIIGSGYVGLVTGTCFAEMGHNVICLDIDAKKIDDLNQGRVPFYEPGLEEIVQRNMKNKRLRFTTSYKEGVTNSELSFIAVSTPQAEDESAELRYVDQAAKSIAEHIEDYHIIINKSTVPVGTANRVRTTIQKRLDELEKDVPFDVASNPEFLKEGSAVYDFMKPDRIVIGVDNEKVGGILRSLYASFSVNHDKILIMDILSAELTKYASNAMLAARISFMNEIANICEEVGADVGKVRKAVGADKRLGYNFLYPGAGYGGSCFPKDIKAFRSTAKKYKCGTDILDAVETVNQKQKQLLAQKIESYFKGELEGKTIGIWGLSFKPDTDDMRQAPALTLIKILHEQGAQLQLYDPIAMENAKLYVKGLEDQITWCANELEAAESADAVVLITEWRQFRFINLEDVLSKMKGHAFFDGRNQYQPKEMASLGFDYISIGRKGVYADLRDLQTYSR